MFNFYFDYFLNMETTHYTNVVDEMMLIRNSTRK